MRGPWQIVGLLVGMAATASATALPAAPLGLPASARVLVVSPHPDDETIAAGGLLARLTRRGVPVRVVFVTNGDGYPYAVTRALGVRTPTSADYLAYGRQRQAEALDALAHLGVEPRDVRFLGFPDGGLAALWADHWSRVYTSPYTREDRPPYAGSPHVEYEGHDLTLVLQRIVRAFRPTVILMPHPHDTHLDHAHTSYFVTEAVTGLEAHGLLSPRPSLLTYLVHHPRWPLHGGTAGERIVPTPEVADTAWLETELAPEELAAKRAALAAYHTQLAVMGGFLESFLTRNELLARVDDRLLGRIARIH